MNKNTYFFPTQLSIPFFVKKLKSNLITANLECFFIKEINESVYYRKFSLRTIYQYR